MGTALFSLKVRPKGDDAIAADLRFEFTRLTCSGSDLKRLREGLEALDAINPLMFWFRQKGYDLQESGRVAEALEEYRSLEALHPKEALHHAQQAMALVAGGLKEEALAEAEEAVRLEPESAFAHQTLGRVRRHNAIGQDLERGFDRDGSLAAYRQAKTLAPQDAGIRLELAVTLEYGSDAVRFGPGADIEGAIQEYRTIREEFKDNSYDTNYLLILLQSGRFKEAVEASRAMQEDEQRRVLAAAALTASQGASKAIEDLNRRILDRESRKRCLAMAAVHLFRLRLYPEGVRLMREAAKGATAPAAATESLKALEKVRRVDPASFSDDTPENLIFRWLIALFENRFDAANYGEYFAVEAEAETKSGSPDLGFDEIRAGLAKVFRASEMPPEVLTDITLSVMTYERDGSPTAGVRLRPKFPGQRQPKDSVLFLVPSERGWRILGSEAMLAPLGIRVLACVERGDLVSARQWLDWAVEAKQSHRSSDPFLGPSFLHFWQAGKGGDADRIRNAAAALMADGPSAKQAIPILTAGWEKAPEDAQTPCDAALLEAYFRSDEFAAMLALAERLTPLHPESDILGFYRFWALSGLKRYEDALQLVRQRLEGRPGDLMLWRQLIGLHYRLDDIAGVRATLQSLLDNRLAEAQELNDYAWLSLFNGTVDDRILDLAQQAGKEKPNGAVLHTLATIMAERGKPAESIQALRRSLQARNSVAFETHDWYVLGRLAELCRLPEAAIRYYQRVTQPEKSDNLSISTYTLAQRRLNALAPAPQPGASAAVPGSSK